MNKDDRINDFFNVFKSLKMQYPDYIMNRNTVYFALTKIGTVNDNRYLLSKDPIYDKIIKREGLFDRWVKNFEDSSNYVHVDPHWDYFCQFEYGNLKEDNDGEFIKMYIPIDYGHIELGANKIFKFIESKGIKHLSKIGSDIRMDNIVIRVTNKKDADEIINFIKSDSFIQRGLMPANPFAFSKDGIALACDGNSSYNSVLGSLLTDFMNSVDVNNYNALSFYQFLSKLNFDIENGYTNVEDFINYNFGTTRPNEKDFKRILRLIINSHNPNFDYNDYLSHFYQEIDSEKGFTIENNLIMALKVMLSKYSLNQTICTLQKFIETGEMKYLTRKDNLRKLLINSNFRNSIINIMNDNNISFVQLCNYVLEKFDVDQVQKTPSI